MRLQRQPEVSISPPESTARTVRNYFKETLAPAKEQRQRKPGSSRHASDAGSQRGPP